MTQDEIVLEHLNQRGSITSFEAMMDHRIVYLPARIFYLRAKGHDIESVRKMNKLTKKRYVRYYLRRGKEAAA